MDRMADPSSKKMQLLRRFSTLCDSKYKPVNALRVTTFSVKPEPQENEPKPQYDPFHLMLPDVPFKPEKARNIIKKCMHKSLDDIYYAGTVYDASSAKQKAIDLANTIKIQIKQRHFSRYKYVVSALIVEKKHQDLTLSRKVLQSVENDGYAEYVFENNSLIAHCVVVAFYCE